MRIELTLAAMIGLASCTSSGNDDSGFVDGGDGGGAANDGGGDGGGGETFSTSECTLDPLLSEEVHTIRAGSDGSVWLSDITGDLYRYEPTGDADCTLQGQLMWDDGALEDVTDFDLDAAGNAYALIFFSTLVRIAPDGSTDLGCEVPAGHGIAVSADGSLVYSVPIGAEELVPTTIDGEVCTMSSQPVALAHGIGTAPVFSGDLLAVDSHDPTGDLAPGYLLDPSDGSALLDLGIGTDPISGLELAAIADLAVTDGGYWAVGSPDGALWHLHSSGTVTQRWAVDEILPVAGDPDPTLYADSIGYSATGPSYVAAGFISLNGVWRISLDP